MELNETAAVLAMIAALDRRSAFNETDAIAWHAILTDYQFDDCRTAVVKHYSDTSYSIMPADIVRIVRQIRSKRRDAVSAPLPPVHPDNVNEFKAWTLEWYRAIADGLTEDEATDRANLNASLQRGITQSAQGETAYLGDFTQYVQTDIPSGGRP